MLIDTFPFETVWKALHGESAASRSIVTFVQSLERRLGFRAVFEADQLPFGRTDISNASAIADVLLKNGVIASYAPVVRMPDEPYFHQWRAVCSDRTSHVTGGMSAERSEQALFAALGEALERYLWFVAGDYFDSARIDSYEAISTLGSAISPGRFAGFSDAQRARNERLTLEQNTEYLWTRGWSWAQRAPVYIPAQTIAHVHCSSRLASHREPIIRSPITTGLATYPVQENALLSGALEVIERDAYMIMWLNQLSLPRISVAALRGKRASLDKLLDSCERYRFSIEIVRLITDAPTYVLCAVITDETGLAPQITLGLKAHRNLAMAAEDAILEGLRARLNVRTHHIRKDAKPFDKKPGDVVHMERVAYWCTPERAQRLQFLTKGPFVDIPHEAWDNDAPAEHWKRVCDWCRSRDYELASVPLTKSRRNPLPWHVEMVVIPELQPMHQNERLPYLGGKRLREVPEMFGYNPRTVPFADEPHPFA